MPKIVSILLPAVLLFVPPAQAADQKQCADQFKAADLDNDGVLNRTEIGNARQSLPSSLANKERVTRKEFMAVCSKGATRN